MRAVVAAIMGALCLATPAVVVRVSGLRPDQDVVVRSSTPDADGREWNAEASFRADVLTGTLRLALPGGGTAPAVDAVVWVAGALRPAARSSAQPPAVTSREKRFDPHVLVVTRGTTVSFPNVDPIFHNAFSRTPGSEFDLGLYRRGAARGFTFRSAGLVRLYCNIHAEMAAYVLVLDPEDAFAVADGAGAFRLTSLPAGRHVVHVWSEKGGEKELTVDLGAEGAAPLEVALDASTYRPMPHKNKFGKDYPPATQGVDRY